jgi:hypothetical protein
LDPSATGADQQFTVPYRFLPIDDGRQHLAGAMEAEGLLDEQPLAVMGKTSLRLGIAAAAKEKSSAERSLFLGAVWNTKPFRASELQCHYFGSSTFPVEASIPPSASSHVPLEFAVASMALPPRELLVRDKARDLRPERLSLPIGPSILIKGAILARRVDRNHFITPANERVTYSLDAHLVSSFMDWEVNYHRLIRLD